jgi:hypothetical protein
MIGLGSFFFSLSLSLSLSLFLLAAVALQFLKSSRGGSKAFIVQWCAIKFRRYLAIIEYGGGGLRGFVVILGGRGGRGWAGFVLELQKVLETFQTSFGDVPKAHHSGEPLGQYSLSGHKVNPSVPSMSVVCAPAGEAIKMSYGVRCGIGWTKAVYGGFHVSWEGLCLARYFSVAGSEGQRPWRAWGCCKSLLSFTLVHYMLQIVGVN